MIAALLGAGAGRGCVSGGVSAGQCGQAAVERGRAERGAGAGLAAACATPAAPVAAAAFAGRVLGTVSAALIAASRPDRPSLMPLVITALAPGFAGSETLQFAVDDARLMLPYLAFAGPVTVMMALLNAQGRFALTAFSPLLFNIALIGVMIVLLGWRQDAADAALAIAGDGRHRRTAAIADSGRCAAATALATPLRVSFDARDARLSRQGDPRHDRQRRAAIA